MSETTNEIVDTQALPVDQVAETTNETPAAEPAQPAGPTPEEIAQKLAVKRIAKLTYEKNEALREAKAAREMLAANLGGNKPPAAEQPQDFDRRVNQTAAQMRADEAFTDACNQTFAKGMEEFPDFKASVQAYDLIGGLQDKREFISAINALPNGHAVYHHLGKNLDAASDILDMDPVQMAIKLAQLSGSLAKPKKAVSNAPAPPPSLGGNAAPSTKDPNKMTMQEYMEWRKATL
jgi:hypothetical protein